MAQPFRHLDVSELTAELNRVLANAEFVASNGFSVTSKDFNAIGVLREYESNAERGDLLVHLQLNAVADDTPQDLIKGVQDAIRDASASEDAAMQEAAQRTEHILSQTYTMSDLQLMEVKLVLCSTYDPNQVARMDERGWVCFRDVDAAGTYRLAARVRSAITAVHCAEESFAVVLKGDEGVLDLRSIKRLRCREIIFYAGPHQNHT